MGTPGGEADCRDGKTYYTQEEAQEWKKIAMQALKACDAWREKFNHAQSKHEEKEHEILKVAGSLLNKKETQIDELLSQSAKAESAAFSTIKNLQKKTRQTERRFNDRGSLNQDLKTELAKREMEIGQMRLREQELEEKMDEQAAAFDRREQELLYGRAFSRRSLPDQ
jgi:hypothetical protein